MASKAVNLAKAGWKMQVAKWVFSTSEFRRYGLYSQDTLNEWEPAVKLAVQRLPDDVYNQRMFRISRALQLSNQKIQLPRNEWTNFEDDLNNRYLDGILESVQAELAEQREWETKA